MQYWCALSYKHICGQMQRSDWSDLLICIRQNKTKKHQPWSEKINAANSSELLRFNWIFNTEHIHTDPVCERPLKLWSETINTWKTWWSRAHFKGFFPYRLLNNRTYSCNQSRCLLLVMRKNAGLKHFCTDWTLQTLKLCCPVSTLIIFTFMMRTQLILFNVLKLEAHCVAGWE